MCVTDGAVLGAVAVCALSGAVDAAPQAYDCTLARDAETLRLRFDLDPSSFAPPLDSAEPPHRTVSHVKLRDAGFEAEAILTENGARGFWSAERGWLLTMERDGAARLSDDAQGAWTGYCRETG
jgi:hypothetical protein